MTHQTLFNFGGRVLHDRPPLDLLKRCWHDIANLQAVDLQENPNRVLYFFHNRCIATHLCSTIVVSSWIVDTPYVPLSRKLEATSSTPLQGRWIFFIPLDETTQQLWYRPHQYYFTSISSSTSSIEAPNSPAQQQSLQAPLGRDMDCDDDDTTSPLGLTPPAVTQVDASDDQNSILLMI